MTPSRRFRASCPAAFGLLFGLMALSLFLAVPLHSKENATAAKPTITKYIVPSTVTCSGPTMITIRWKTQNAHHVTISIDGPGIYGTYPPNGKAQFPFACDGNPHKYMIKAYSATGQTAMITKKVKQN